MVLLPYAYIFYKKKLCVMKNSKPQQLGGKNIKPRKKEKKKINSINSTANSHKQIKNMKMIH